MPLVGGQGLAVQLTLFPPRGADNAHHITACPPGFENLAASLYMYCPKKLGPETFIRTEQSQK